jgi:signal transduction histidine kinase
MPFKPLTFLKTSTIERTVTGLLALAFVLLVLVAAASTLATVNARDLNREAARNELVRRTARQVLIDTLNAETGQRGYLLTGQKEYLGVHHQALARLSAEMADLRRLTDHRPGEAHKVDRLRIQIDAKIAELKKTIAFMDAHRRDEALAMVRSGNGRAFMGRIRGLIDEIDASEGTLLTRHAHEAELAAQQALGVNLASAVLIGVVGMVSLAVMRRYIDDLRRSRAELDTVNQGLERTVAERTEELVRANEEIQRFAYIVSHDLRAPLVNIMGYTAEMETAASALALQIDAVKAKAPKLLLPDADQAIREDVPEAIGFIRSSSEKMDRLIKAILHLSRDGRRVLRPEPITMTGEIRAVAANLSHQAGEIGAQITVEELPDIVTDRLALDQVIGNLLDNALKYLDPERPGRIVVRGHEQASFVIYEIEDNGRGVAPRDHERIFELFRRAGPQDRPGEGLGLAFVKNAVRRLGGTIHLRSELAQGSTFVLKLPKRLAVEVSEAAGESA